MNERIVHDIQITETEDGFRIEIKGDKEILRRWIDRAGAFFSNMDRRGPHHEHFRGHGPFGWHEHGGFGPFSRHEPEQHHHGGFGPFGGHQHGPFGRPGPSHEEIDNLRSQAREWKQEAREWKRDLRDQMREWRRHGGPFGWNVNPEERDAWVQHMKDWWADVERQFKGVGPFGPEPGRRPYPWYGRREKRKRGAYDLGPWWDEGEAADDLPTI